VRIQLREVPGQLFPTASRNELVIRIQVLTLAITVLTLAITVLTLAITVLILAITVLILAITVLILDAITVLIIGIIGRKEAVICKKAGGGDLSQADDEAAGARRYPDAGTHACTHAALMRTLTRTAGAPYVQAPAQRGPTPSTCCNSKNRVAPQYVDRSSD
jgi:hypothetical protein